MLPVVKKPVISRLLRLGALFLFALVAMSLSYGAGFATALRMPPLVGSHGQLSPVAARQGVAAPSNVVQPPIGRPGEPADFDLFWEAYQQILEEYYGPLPDESELTYGAIRGSLRALQDPFTVFTDPKTTAIERPELDREFEGIGAYVTQNENGELVIQTPMRGQPAERAGLMAGDIVIEVDGVDITHMSTEDAVLLIRGPKGTTVRLTIKREGVPEPFVVPVVRDKIDVPSVNEVRLLTEEGAPQVGYLQLTVFAAETRQELRQAIDELRNDGARALILDLRNNPGGYLNSAVEVASEFISSGVVVYQEDQEANRVAEFALPGGHALDIPLVVLVNRGSASASEIVAGALRDHGRAVLVGERTFGKGSVQNVHNLSDESQLRVTVAVWLTPSGAMIHEQGIQPDLEVQLTADDLRAGRDPQLEVAIQQALKLLEDAS